MRTVVDVIFDILTESKERKPRFLTFYLFSTKNYHNGKSVPVNDLKCIPFSIEPMETLKDRIYGLHKDYDDMEIALSSQVLLEKAVVLYIPMVDLCSKDQKVLEERLTENGKDYEEFTPGSLLCSGKSYHYYGHRLLEEDEWLKFLGGCLLCVSIDTGKKVHLADNRWIGHTIRRNLLGLLRIFERLGDEKRARPQPYLVAEIK